MTNTKNTASPLALTFENFGATRRNRTLTGAVSRTAYRSATHRAAAHALSIAGAASPSDVGAVCRISTEEAYLVLGELCYAGLVRTQEILTDAGERLRTLTDEAWLAG